jgi:hypothetical protein
MVIQSKKDKKSIKKNQHMKKNKHNCFSGVVKKLMFLSSPMLCVSHFYPFSHISGQTILQLPQAKHAATYRAKC